MSYTPHFTDFYRRTIVPMGDSREHFLQTVTDGEEWEELTHWFVAIEGSLKTVKPEYFQWTVLVFPSQEDGAYPMSIEPVYKSEAFDTLEAAFDHSCETIRTLKMLQLCPFLV